MIPKPNAKVSKGMMFLGCSFTWGQGLYYYSNMPTIREPLPDHYDPKLVTEAHLQHKNRLRYPRLVADHYDAWEVVHPFNGGSNHSAVKWFKSWLTNTDTSTENRDAGAPPKLYDFSEISHAFIQLTQFQRNNFILEHKGERHNIPLAMTHGDKHLEELFFDYLNSIDLDIHQWIHRYMQDQINEVKEFLMLCENNGVKTGLLTWVNEHLPFIKADPWLAQRFITLDYKDNTFESIEDLMSKHKECEIKHDYESFAETPKDHHPSRTCHRVMADSVIKYVDRVGF
jgi:hypothetical protein